jgi:hypothetical protein
LELHNRCYWPGILLREHRRTGLHVSFHSLQLFVPNHRLRSFTDWSLRPGFLPLAANIFG